MPNLPITTAEKGHRLKRQLHYAWKCFPPYLWQRFTRRSVSGRVHRVLAVADHFEPSGTPGDFPGYAPKDVQEGRLETWWAEYLTNFESNPGDDRDYRYQLTRNARPNPARQTSRLAVRG
jgi:hypothetical protein